MRTDDFILANPHTIFVRSMEAQTEPGLARTIKHKIPVAFKEKPENSRIGYSWGRELEIDGERWLEINVIRRPPPLLPASGKELVTMSQFLAYMEALPDKDLALQVVCGRFLTETNILLGKRKIHDKRSFAYTFVKQGIRWQAFARACFERLGITVRSDAFALVVKERWREAYGVWEGEIVGKPEYDQRAALEGFRMARVSKKRPKWRGGDKRAYKREGLLRRQENSQKVLLGHGLKDRR